MPLVGSISRAVNLCETTLAFGKAEEARPALTLFHLSPLVADVIEALIRTYREGRSGSAERFVDTVRRLGLDAFKGAANAVRSSTAQASTATA